MLEVKLDAESQKLVDAFIKKLGDPRLVMGGILKLFEKLATRAAAFIVQTRLSSGTVAGMLKRRSGMLAKSVAGRALWVGKVPSFRVGVFRGPALAYAGVLERGTRGLEPDSPYDTIRPKKARALAMPVDEGLTPAGVARYPGPRDYPGTLRFIPFRNSGVAIGALYDAESLTKGPDGRIDWSGARRLYVLLKQVDIPAYHYLRDGLRNFMPHVATELAALLKGMFNATQSV